MAYITVIEDDLGNEVGWLYTANDKYLLADNSQMFVRTLPSWCHICRCFTLAEDIKPAEYYEKLWRDFVAKKNERPLGAIKFLPREMQVAIQDRQAEQYRNEAVQWRLALQLRVAPAKCLECGTSNWVAVTEDGKWNRHPGTDGLTQARVQDSFTHISLVERGRLYDLEGNRIPGRHAE